MMRAIQNSRTLAERVEVADTFSSRFLGLMGKRSLDSSEGLLLRKCSRVHTCFMLFPIDVAYLSSTYNVLSVETLSPWKMGSRVKGAAHVLELSVGKKEEIVVGCEIEFV